MSYACIRNPGSAASDLRMRALRDAIIPWHRDYKLHPPAREEKSIVGFLRPLFLAISSRVVGLGRSVYINIIIQFAKYKAGVRIISPKKCMIHCIINIFTAIKLRFAVRFNLSQFAEYREIIFNAFPSGIK